MRDKKDPGKTISEKINKIDNLYIVKQFTDKKSLECVNPDIITKFGWCYLKDFPERHENNDWKEAWGICSPSCDPEVIQVWLKNTPNNINSSTRIMIVNFCQYFLNYFNIFLFTDARTN